MAHRRRGQRREEPVEVVEEVVEVVEEIVDNRHSRKNKSRRNNREREVSEEVIIEEAVDEEDQLVEENQPRERRSRKDRKHKSRNGRHQEEVVEIEEIQEDEPIQTDAEPDPEVDEDEQKREDESQNGVAEEEKSKEESSEEENKKKKEKLKKQQKEKIQLEPISSDKSKRNPLIGKAPEKDLDILRKIAEGKTSKYAHCFGKRSYANIKIIPTITGGKGYAVASILLSTTLPETVISDTMECREEDDRLCILNLPISDISARILISHVYEQDIESILKTLNINEKKVIIEELSDIQALPLVQRLYNDKDLINVGDPKSLASYITTKAASNQPLGGVKISITPPLLKELNVNGIVYLAKQVAKEHREIKIKCDWCLAQELLEPRMEEKELYAKTEEVLSTIPDDAAIIEERDIIGILNVTKNLIIYRFLFIRCCGINLTLVPQKKVNEVKK